jgi:Tol biopolymer transport system component
MTRRILPATAAALLLLSCQENPAEPPSRVDSDLSSAKPAPPPPANPEIAFSNSGIWVMDRDGGNAVRVTPRNLTGSNPSWSPLNYGTPSSPVYRIAYDRGELSPFSVIEVRVVNGTPVGGTPTVLRADGRLPAWSPLGDEIAYIRADSAIWVIKSDGSNAHQVAVRDTQETFTRVTWSGDGQRLAWIEDAEDYSGNPIRTIKTATRTGPSSWSAPTALYVVGRTPGGLSSLTWSNKGDSLLFCFADIRRIAMLHPGRTPPVDTLNVEGGRPVWSPDDRQILYVIVGGQPKLALYSRASGTTTVISNRNDLGRPDWRRLRPGQ